MSLTELIRSDKELRHRIRKVCHRPEFDRSRPILAKACATHPSLVGTAFDYLLRFRVEKINGTPRFPKPWIAEQALMSLNDGAAVVRGEAIVQDARRLQKHYHATGILPRDLIRRTLQMSVLDAYYRSGCGAEHVGEEADDDDVVDLEQQLRVVRDDSFRVRKLHILNPTFGNGSFLIGGADADLLLDDAIVDIKTTRKPGIQLADFCQIVGYYLLARIGGVMSDKRIKVRRLGFYYARYGYSLLFPVSDMAGGRELFDLTSWFRSRIERLYPTERRDLTQRLYPAVAVPNGCTNGCTR